MNCDGYQTKSSSERELQSWCVAAPGEGGLLTWGNCYRGDSVESHRGTNPSVLKWGVDLGSVGRFHYRM